MMEGKKMAIYRGLRHSLSGGQLVTKDDDILSPVPSQKLYNHAPDFNWGYGGSGPAQLALALLLDATGDEEVALNYHQNFKWEFVARWKDDWVITSEAIKEWLNDKTDNERALIRRDYRHWLHGN